MFHNKIVKYGYKCFVPLPQVKRISKQPHYFWDNEQNVIQFLTNLKEKYNLQTLSDWNSITQKQIQLNGGRTLLNKYSMYEIKCLGFPEGKNQFKLIRKKSGYWDNKQNINDFLNKLKEKYNLQTKEDWNLITQKQIQLLGGSKLLNKLSMYEIKCLGFPDGKLFFTKSNSSKPPGYWNKEENVLQFLKEVKQKFNLKTIEDWNLITQKHIRSCNGGNSIIQKYSIYDLKCLGFPEGKLYFKKSISSKPSGYWNNEDNILRFFGQLKEKFHLKTIEDWNLVTQKQIKSIVGGNSLLQKYSMFEIKNIGCPDGKSYFNKRSSVGYWDNEHNRCAFFENLKNKFNLYSPSDWQRLSREQIKSQGGSWLFSKSEYAKNTFVSFEIHSDSETFKHEKISLKELLHPSQLKVKQVFKRSSQRWLFLQVQKLFPHEEIVEDYFHSELSRKTGSTVQFDVFLIKKNIAIEYHGKQHYEDIPAGFAPLEFYNNRDNEKEKLCKEYGIQLIIIPYWWDNKLDSLRETLLKYEINGDIM